LLLAVALAYGRTQQQVAQVTDQLTAELQATHQLVTQTAVTPDDELLNTLLFPNQPWRELQASLRAQSLFWNYASLSLWLDPTALTAAAETAVHFSPDLQTAELTTTLPYITMDANEITSTLSLQHTAVYRRVNQQWLLAPPDDTFWGNEQTLTANHLMVRFPNRDAAIAQRLLADLAPAVEQMCQQLPICPPQQFQVELKLSSQPRSLLRLNQNYQVRTLYNTQDGRILEIILPTPTLVGLPLDDAGYQALRRGYAAQLLAHLISNLDSNCCAFGPVPPSPFALYLQEQNLLPPRPPEYHPVANLFPPPVPLPDEDVLALCTSGSTAVVMRYAPQTAVWTREFLPEDSYIFKSAPLGNDGFLVALAPTTDRDFQLLLLLQNGRTTLVHEGADLLQWQHTQPDPNTPGAYLLHWQISNTAPMQIYLLNARNCSTAACPLTPIDQWGLPSADGRSQLLLTLDAPYTATLGNANGAPTQTLTNILSPVWLAENTLGYLHITAYDNEGLPQQTVIQTAQVTNGRILSNTITTHELPIPSNIPAQQITTLIPHPTQPHTLIAVVNPANQNDPFVVTPTLLYSYNWRTNTAALLPGQPLEQLHQLHISPNQQYLTALAISADSQQPFTTKLHLLDLQTGNWHEFGLDTWGEFGWSADGRWLALPGEQTITLIHPQTGYTRPILHNLTSCNTAIWITPAN
jgi:hypothetical protein